MPTPKFFFLVLIIVSLLWMLFLTLVGPTRGACALGPACVVPVVPAPWPSQPEDLITEPNRPRLFDRQGNFRGILTPNPYDPNSISAPFNRYGNRWSPDSLLDPYNAGNPYTGGVLPSLEDR